MSITVKEKKEARELALEMLGFAQANVSGKRVGAAVVASNGHRVEMFGGCNIELSTSTVFHAERVALLKAVSSGYINIIAVYVTSSSIDQRVALCGYCRQDFMYVNPQCRIVVLNPDGSVKLSVKLIDTLKYPYLGKGRLGVNAN